MNLVQKLFSLLYPQQKAKEKPLNLSDYKHIYFSVGVIEFADNVENDSGKVLARLLGDADYFKSFYYEHDYPQNILSLESRTIFDLIDRGQSLLDRTKADVIIWGKREGDKIAVMVHYPPFDVYFADSVFTELIAEYDVDAVVYGHLHGKNVRVTPVVEKHGISYHLTSCDLVGNTLVRIF